MKVVYNLIKYPLIYCFIGCFILELIITLVFFFTFNIVLVNNEKKIKNTLLNQTEELFNSINYLLQTKLITVEKELLLFNQHMFINYTYRLDPTQINYDNCELIDSKYITSENIFEKYDLIAYDKKDRSIKIKELLNDELLQKIAFYTPENPNDYKYKFNGDKIKNNICYALSFWKTSFIKNVINLQHREKLNYTLYVDDVIFFYPAQYINDKILRSLPFYSPSVLCRDQRYKFECSSILKYKPSSEESYSLYNSIIIMNLKLKLNYLYINMCLAVNDIENEKINMDPFFLYEEESKPSDPPNNFFCITANISNILDQINQDSSYFLFNIIQYDEESDSIKVLHSSNEYFYKNISLNKDINSKLFISEEYGKYRILNNSHENIADLFHSLYYEIEKYNHPDKKISKYINEYEKNIKEIKELISTKNNKAFDGYTKSVEQSYINYVYDNKGKIAYRKSDIEKIEFVYSLKPIITTMGKINNKKNLIEKNDDDKRIIFYTITIMKVTKPKNSSFLYLVYFFICSRIFFYSLILEFFICIIFYILVFFLMRCLLNPFNTFRGSIEGLLDNKNKNKGEEEQIVKKATFSEKDKKNSFNKKNNLRTSMRMQNETSQLKNNNQNQIKNMEINNINDADITKKEYMNTFIKITSEIDRQYTNLEMKEIENIITFLQKILLLRDENTPYQAKADFYQSISSEISKKYQLDLFKCQILIGEYYIKDKQYLKAKNELESLQMRIEQSKNDLVNKDKLNEKKNGFLSTYYGTYINDYTTKTNIKEDKFIRLEMISESYHYLIGLANYFLFLELKHKKKKFMNEYMKPKNISQSKASMNKETKSINKNITIASTFDINSGANNMTTQMDYYLEKAIRHFKESYKINNSLQINQIKNIIILVYLSKCYLEFSNKSIEEANKVLKKAFLTLTNFNDLIIELTGDDSFSIKKKKFNNNFEFLLYKNIGNYISNKIKDCYVDSRVMLIVNGSLIQFILYQIGKMALKLHKNKVAYYCFVKIIQISFFKNENLHFKAIKWIRFLLNSFAEKRKSSNIGGLKSFIVKLKYKRTNSNMSINLGNEEEIYINKSSIDFMKKYLKNLVEIFEKNKYKRREKKTIIELLDVLDKKIVYRQKVITDEGNKKKPSFKNFAKNFLKLNQTQSSLTSSNKELNISSGQDTLKNQDASESNSSHKYSNMNDKNGTSPININEKPINRIEKVISKSEYEAITKNYISRDLLIAQIINSPLKITEEEKTMKYIDKQYFRLNPKDTSNKCLIIILSETFLQSFSSLKSFNLFIQDCIVKFLEETDKIGFILFSFSSGLVDKIYELEYKSIALKNLEELFKNASSMFKNRKSINKNKYLTDSFDMAMEMFNNEQLNNNTAINAKMDKYIFCFGTLYNLRYKCYEASFSQKNRINYMEISLYFFVFDSINYYREKLPHYKKYFKKFIEGFLVFVENFKLIKLCFANICIKGKQKNLFSNKLECIQNII